MEKGGQGDPQLRGTMSGENILEIDGATLCTRGEWDGPGVCEGQQGSGRVKPEKERTRYVCVWWWRGQEAEQNCREPKGLAVIIRCRLGGVRAVARGL